MKKIFLLSVLLSQLVIGFGQTVGSIVKSKTIFSSLGVTVSYTVTYYGVGDCNNNTATGHKKYRLNFNAQNNSSSTVRLVASRIDLDDNLDRFKSNCYSSEAILLGSYPGFEQFGTLIPGENVNATKYVYMDQRSSDLPYVTYNFVASIVKAQPTKNSNTNQNTNNATTAESKTYENIQEAIAKFNSLINQTSTADLQKVTQLQNSIQSTLNNSGNSETFKLRIINNGINDLENLIAKNNSNSNNNSPNQTNNSNQQTTPQNDLTEYNRSKAEMEQKIQEENERRQQQATQLNNQKQQFINVYNEGVQFGNTGKYAEAAAKYQQAIGLATNDADRQTAQNAYNKINKSNNQTQAINQVTNSLGDLLSALKEEKEKKAEQKRLVQQDKEIEGRKRAEAAVNTLKDPNIFNAYCDFIVSNLSVLDLKFIEMSDYMVTPTMKGIKINFANNVVVRMTQWYSDSRMRNEIHFRTTNFMFSKLLNSSDLFEYLKQFDYDSQIEGHSNFRGIQTNSEEFIYVFDLFSLENAKPFINIYMNGYTSQSYKGASYYIKQIEDKVQTKVSNTQATTKELIESGDMYRDGKGVEKNNVKALEFYQKAVDAGDNEALLSIAQLYFAVSGFTQAKGLYEKYINTAGVKDIDAAKLRLANTFNQLGDFDKAIGILKDLFIKVEADYNNITKSTERYYAKQKLYMITGSQFGGIGQFYVNKGNVEEGIKWYEKASNYNPFAASQLAFMYKNGQASQWSKSIKNTLPSIKIKKNTKLAKEWADKACKVANEDVMEFGNDLTLRPGLDNSAKYLCESAAKNYNN